MADPSPAIGDDEELAIKPAKPERRSIGGVYNTRSLSRTRSTSSQDGRTEVAGIDEDDNHEWLSEDGKKKQVFKGTALLWLAYQSIGAIYGDIGTSPLYVYSSTFTAEPSYEVLVEVLSVIIWSLTIMVTFKYVLIVLRADNQGEGGTFSCYSLLTRYANLTDRDPREAASVKMERHMTQDLSPSNHAVRRRMEDSKFLRGLLKTIGVLAVSMVIADGILTPAQSVLGAIQGLSVVSPGITSSTIVGTSSGILILLFAIQPLGLTKLASSFAPVVIVWLAFNASFGIYNLVKYDHSVLKAFSPYYAIHFFVRGKTEAWKRLGGILLSFTGVEALFADLGAFSMRAIQISWLGYCYPALLLAYIGQAAYISVHPAAYSNPFFNSVPPGLLYPSLVVAVLAAVVASQAMITACFQLVSQLMKLSYCPQVKIVHTSTKFHGQLYVPFLNWLLLIGTVLVTAVYSNTTRLGNAYGVCVIFVTFFDTCFVTLVALIVWRISPYVLFVPWLFFATHDGLYLTSALNKVPDGAWFTLTLAAILAGLFLLWRFGKENQWRAEAEDRFRLNELIKKGVDDKLFLAARWGGGSVAPIRGFGIYFDKTGVLTPTVFTQFVTKFGAVPEVMIFFHLHPVEIPTVPSTERYIITRLGAVPGCYRLAVRHGFMDEVITPDLAALIYEQVRKFIVRQAGAEDLSKKPEIPGEVSGASGGSSGSVSEDLPLEQNGKGKQCRNGPAEIEDAKVRRELACLDRAFATKISYVVGKEQMRIKGSASLPRRLVLETFLFIRDNTRAKVANLRLAMDRVVEVGFVKEI
ncbi:potassium uptake protein [Xylaria bambusicola]|uniref:potassium uptake protein n=1 Tax=Xylaria bambusicola TaxID=326684 RepID=UPI0020089238|nr:potassium uptake protein [Xylaria bambusicola]KAI0515225.1 potassium uptake protein [Xylaria bambusicola]